MKVQLFNPEPGLEGSPERHARIVPSLADVGLDPLVPAGAVIDVPDDVAGAGPHWRAPRDGELDDPQHLAYLRDTGSLRLNDDGSVRSVHDLGHGLLAQTDLWFKVETKTAKPQKED